MQKDNSEKLVVRCIGVLFFSLFFTIAGLVCLFLVPSKAPNPMSDAVEKEVELANIPLIEANPVQDLPELPVVQVSLEESFMPKNFSDTSYKISIDNQTPKIDSGLELYRSIHSKAAVEWFYTSITESRDIACAVLEAADKNDIPLSLAFALAYTESRYKVTAVNKNKNSSIDRGLFQLNNKSFPDLEESDFFDPYTSAKYGMSHLRHCLNTAGNEVSALAMYNAGTNRVRNNATPQVTLNYVSNIINYRQGLDELFDSEVVQFYKNGTNLFIAANTPEKAKSVR